MVAFLIDGIRLTPDEDKHLLQCEECMLAMIEGATKELRKRRDEGMA